MNASISWEIPGYGFYPKTASVNSLVTVVYLFQGLTKLF